MKRKIFWAALACGGFGFVTTSLLAQTPKHEPTPAVCSKYESGIIESGGEIKGPIVITMLQRGVDPAAPTRGWIIIVPGNTWISIDEFKGPYFLKKGESLKGRADWTKGQVVYSGLRCAE
jgi:hypothetical protein